MQQRSREREACWERSAPRWIRRVCGTHTTEPNAEEMAVRRRVTSVSAEMFSAHAGGNRGREVFAAQRRVTDVSAETFCAHVGAELLAESWQVEDVSAETFCACVGSEVISARRRFGMFRGNVRAHVGVCR